MLCIPAWPHDDPDLPEAPGFFICSMNWSREDAEKLTKEFEALAASMYTAEEWPAPDTDEEYIDFTVDIRAKRAFTVIKMDGPGIVRDRELRFLAQAMVLQKHCVSAQLIQQEIKEEDIFKMDRNA